MAEGLVLAADSAVVLQGTMNTPLGPQTGILQRFAYANKATRIKTYPVGVLSWGLGSINNRSIQSLIMEFEHGYQSMEANRSYTVREIADELFAFIKSRYDAATPPGPNRPILGFLIGGYSAGQFFADEFVCEFPSATGWTDLRPDQPNGSPSFGANWFGMTDALSRLFGGYDPAALQELVNRGADAAIVQKWVGDNVSQMPIVFDGMPLQDAVDFALYAIQVVIGRFRFGLGAELCGGDIDVAVITPTAFRWAQRKRWAISE